MTDEERSERLPSGKKFKFDDRVQWANTYLKKAGLLQSVGRGFLQITERGYTVIQSNPVYIDRDYLMQFPEFVEFQQPTHQPGFMSAPIENLVEAQKTPQEVLQASYETLREQLAQDLLDAIMQCSPSFFERLVLDLLLALGYGGAIEDAGEVIGRTGDNGIDGVIKEDKLGFDAIYIQAK